MPDGISRHKTTNLLQKQTTIGFWQVSEYPIGAQGSTELKVSSGHNPPGQRHGPSGKNISIYQLPPTLKMTPKHTVKTWMPSYFGIEQKSILLELLIPCFIMCITSLVLPPTATPAMYCHCCSLSPTSALFEMSCIYSHGTLIILVSDFWAKFMSP